MTLLVRSLCAFALAACSLLAQQRENFTYSINWPSGLSLGEGSMTAVANGQHWDFALSLEATIPGFPLRDEYRSRAANDGLCSVTFEKSSTHGTRIASEKLTFDAAAKIVRRETNKGGKSETATDDCARDALAFLFHARKELAQGRIPPPQTIYFGAPYQVTFKHAGVHQVRQGDVRVEADKFAIALKGPASQTNFEISFARDAARTPLVIRSQFVMGSFSMELVP